LLAIHHAGHAQPAGLPRLVQTDFHFEEFVGGRIAPQPAAHATFDLLGRRGFLLQAAVDSQQLLPEPLLLSGQHSLFLFPPGLAAAQDELLLAFSVRVRQQLDFHVLAHLLPVFVFQQGGFKLAQLGFGRAHEVLRVARA
jgi:hypothetical protein